MEKKAALRSAALKLCTDTWYSTECPLCPPCEFLQTLRETGIACYVQFRTANTINTLYLRKRLLQRTIQSNSIPKAVKQTELSSPSLSLEDAEGAKRPVSWPRTLGWQSLKLRTDVLEVLTRPCKLPHTGAECGCSPRWQVAPAQAECSANKSWSFFFPPFIFNMRE